MTLRKTAVIFSAVMLLCVSALWLGTAQAADNGSTYSVTIPDSLKLTQSGWNTIGSISVDSSANNFTQKRVLVTVTSSNNFALVSGTNTIGYTYTAEKSPDAQVTEFKFDKDSLNQDGGLSYVVGVSVDDYSNAPIGTYKDSITYSVEVVDYLVDLSTLTAYEAQDGDILTGTAGADAHITVAAGATITLSNVDITSIPNNNSHQWAGITCEGDATIILSGDNKLKGGNSNYPGIHIAQNYTLTIQGDGSLTASSNGNGAGIGGGFQGTCGNITISGGTITANGGGSAAGIGSGYNASCGAITISGGTITANGGTNGAGIGGGYQASCGNITITTGVTRVTATAGVGTWTTTKHAIGAGDGGSCGTVTIGGTVYANGITTSPYTYITANTGAVTLTDGMTLTGTAGANAHITVAAGATITLDSVDITSIPNDYNHTWAGITCLGDATIILSGDNKVKGGNGNYPGIFISPDAILTIRGDGSLTAESNGQGAGIGGGEHIACGNIVIQGGTITATGGNYAAGIGGGFQASCGNITINGGTITATGGHWAAGIGGGYGSCGNITITTGVTKVTATKGNSAPNSIGAGNSGSCGTVTIGDTEYPDGITDSSYTYTPSN